MTLKTVAIRLRSLYDHVAHWLLCGYGSLQKSILLKCLVVIHRNTTTLTAALYAPASHQGSRKKDQINNQSLIIKLAVQF